MLPSFKGICANDRVTFRTPRGELISGRANALLLFPSHVVVDIGQGRPAVVDGRNYVKHSSKGKQS